MLNFFQHKPALIHFVASHSTPDNAFNN